VEEQPLLIAPDGELHEVLLSQVMLQEPAVMSWFSPNRIWQATETLQSIQLRWEPLDWLSAMPGEIEIEGLDRLRPAGAEVVTAPRSDQAISQRLLEWCYGEVSSGN